MSESKGAGFDPVLIVFLVVVAGVASLGAAFQPGDWYATINKPAWTPPNYLFGPVWSLLYLMIAVAGWLVFRRGQDGMLRGLWILQLVLNGLWSWIFFGLHRTTLGLVDITAMLVVIAAFIFRAWSRQRVAAWLFVPYALWVSYATSLNAGIVAMN